MINGLNAATKEERLTALKELMARYDSEELEAPTRSENVNNHIHTIYSFSPYSPTMAAYLAWKNGLATAGIMDHDSVGGVREFIEAGQIIGIAVTVGFEIRACFKNTPFKGLRLNNPDQDSVAYLAMHGIPHDKIDLAEFFLKPYREARNVRNRRMTEKLGELIVEVDIEFDKDVLPLSQYHDGGSVTERHILYALAGKMLEKFAPGHEIISYLKNIIDVSETSLEKLKDFNCEWYRYHLLNILKGHMVERFYIEADKELPDYRDFIKLAEATGAIPAYAYLGDVGISVTGDKKTQRFEDAYLDELIPFLKEAGFKAVTYMPTRNTDEQLKRLMALCKKHNLFEICGEDINSPFQSFICKALERAEYKHLIDAAWTLIAHERGELMFRGL